MIGILRCRSTSESFTCPAVFHQPQHLTDQSRINRAQTADQSRSNRAQIADQSRSNRGLAIALSKVRCKPLYYAANSHAATPDPVTALCIFRLCISRLHSDPLQAVSFAQECNLRGFFLLALFWNTPTFMQMRLLARIRKRCHFETKVNAQVVCTLKPGLQYTRACLQYTRRTTSHHAAPWRAVLRSTVRIKSHQFAPIEQCSIFCARPRDFAAARLRLQAKLGLFNDLGQKELSKTLVQTNGFCYPSSSSFFLHYFRCFSGENGSFVLQIVHFSRTWCPNHFVSYFEIQILHVSKFFNDFRGNRNLQKMRKKKKRKEKKHKQSNGQKTKNQCDLPFCMPAPFCFLPYWYTCVL